MNHLTEPPDTMSKPLTAAAQSAILSQFPWLANGKVRVTCTHRTEHLLKKAGIGDPKALEYYDLSVRRDESGFLTLNPYCAKQNRAETSDASLFEPGGLFAGDDPPEHLPIPTRAVSLPDSARAELSVLCELPATRTFEIPTGPNSKIRVQVIAFEDESLPSPNEREIWKPSKPTDTQIHAAVSALYLSRRLADLEQL